MGRGGRAEMRFSLRSRREQLAYQSASCGGDLGTECGLRGGLLCNTKHVQDPSWTQHYRGVHVREMYW